MLVFNLSGIFNGIVDEQLLGPEINKTFAHNFITDGT